MRTLFTALAFLVILLAVIPAVKRSLSPAPTATAQLRSSRRSHKWLGWRSTPAEGVWQRLPICRRPAPFASAVNSCFALACDDRLQHFAYHPAQLDATAAYVVDITRATYARLDIPWHSRWRHFQAGGVDRVAQLAQRLAGLDAEARARSAVELAITSVLLDAGAGERWCYREAATGQTLCALGGVSRGEFPDVC